MKRFTIISIFVGMTLGANPIFADEVAKGAGIPFIATNRLVTQPGISYPDSTAPGPVLLELRDIGTIFVSHCPDFVTAQQPGLYYRNTTDSAVDVPAAGTIVSTVNMFLPGEETTFALARTGASVGDAFIYIQQFAKGTVKKVVATVTVSGIFDAALNECRFNGQATIVWH